jgi:hypothetical protein
VRAQVHNAYQLRIQDISYQDQLREHTDKFNQQIEQCKR